MTQPITNLVAGDLIKFGSYRVEASSTLPIIWKVIDKNHTGYPANSVTLLTDKFIDLRGFDAREPANADADRASYGNNRYRSSNLRQWLNSGGAANTWWVAQNLTDGVLNTNNKDATPADAGMVQPTGYDDIQGFMNNFTAPELTKMLDTTLTVAKNTITDGGASEVVTDKVFLLSNTEVGLANENSIVEGSLFSIFAADANRIAYMTDQGFVNTLSASKPATVGTAWYWWLRTPHSSFSYYVRVIPGNGTLSNDNAYNGYHGVRPALNLASDTLVSESVDADGAYTVVDITKILSATVSAGASIFRGFRKNIIASVDIGSTVKKGIGKNIIASVDTGPTIKKGIGKNINASVDAVPTIKKGIGKNINPSVSLTAEALRSAAKLTMVYNGNAELGLGAQEGAQFDIIVTGTFTTFTISMNGKSLTYTENCIDQTITIDNVNATVKNGTTNKLSKVTGDVADFLKLVPGNNVITCSKVGGNVSFVWDFRPQFI